MMTNEQCECSEFESSTHPFIADLQHFGEEEEQQVSPGLAVTLRRQLEEIIHGITAHAAQHGDIAVTTPLL